MGVRVSDTGNTDSINSMIMTVSMRGVLKKEELLQRRTQVQ